MNCLNCAFFTNDDALLCAVNPVHCNIDAGYTSACKEFEHNGYSEVSIDLSDSPEYDESDKDLLLNKHLEYYYFFIVPQLFRLEFPDTPL